MLLGYKKETGEIEFLFTDDSYLEKRFPDNSAKISDFWNNNEHGLTELFISIKEFPNHNDYRLYKVIDNKIIKKSEEEIKLDLNKIKLKKESKNVNNTKDNFLSVEKIKIKSLEDKIKNLEEQLKEKETNGETT
jgi:hypothetical protein